MVDYDRQQAENLGPRVVGALQEALVKKKGASSNYIFNLSKRYELFFHGPDKRF
jgi:hypothetical protein